MKTGINLVLIKLWQIMLKAMMVLDPRGGHFSQDDMETALETCFEKSEFQAAIRVLAANQGKSQHELKSKVAYAIRVMLAHCRIRRKQRDVATLEDVANPPDQHPGWLIDICSGVEFEDSPTPKKAKFSEGKPCPSYCSGRCFSMEQPVAVKLMIKMILMVIQLNLMTSKPRPRMTASTTMAR